MASVLVLGESGAGKELVARLLHERSPRADGPFQVVNCPALPQALVEAELFGIEKGVATGVEARIGRFEAANGGTLLLDEIGDLDLMAQAKLLRVLQHRSIERVGSHTTMPVDVRIVAATHHDLEADIACGDFRRDLYHRLKMVRITLPPLRERQEDIPELVAHCLKRAGRPAESVSPEALALLGRYDYPGNVRELEHAVESAALLSRGPVIEPDDLPEEFRQAGEPATPGEPAAEVACRLYRLVVEDGESFWEVVHLPFLERRLAREPVRLLVERARHEAGSYRQMARLFGVEDEYKKLLNFLQYHSIRCGRRGE
jgi:DNA-binding NtrC family response regulator